MQVSISVICQNVKGKSKNPKSLLRRARVRMAGKDTTQKGVEIKIFKLRAETRTERSLGCQMTIATEKFGRSANRRRGGARNL